MTGPEALPPRAGPALSHPARELLHVEMVPPGVDLAAADLDGAHDRQLERLVGELEDVHPLCHHDRTISCDVDDAEIDALDACGPGRRTEAIVLAMFSLPVTGSCGMLW